MKINIGGRAIGGNEPVLVVAELSANHLQNFDMAVKTIEAMKASGADAVKLQTYTPDTMTIDSEKEYFKINQGTIWDGEYLYKLYERAFTPWDWQPKLKKIAEDMGLIFFSTPFDESSADFLDSMGVCAYKIASCEITDINFIEYVAAKRKPVILSTGIAGLADIEDAVAACNRAGNKQLVILKCISAYPAPVEEMNLMTMLDIRRRFNTIVGLSDHTLGVSVAIAAAALGAKVIEKHFILDRKSGGPDALFSMEPEEFEDMVNHVRKAEKSLGSVTYELTAESKKNREFARSIFVVKSIKAGQPFTKRT